MALSELEIRQLIASGETNKVEFKLASPRPFEMAERLCGMANAHGGLVVIGVEDATLEIIGVPSERIALTNDVILRAVRQIIKPSLVLGYCSLAKG
jgi:predicted HTH transcriptional regulator